MKASGHNEAEYADVLRLLKRYGRNTTSFQALEPGMHYWFTTVGDGDGGVDACVAFADTGGAWVVAGTPIAAEEDIMTVIDRFLEAGRAKKKRIRFFGLEKDISNESCLSMMHIGEQPFWNPQKWQGGLATKRSLREQLRRARAKNVTVRLVATQELHEGSPVRCKIDTMIEHWLHTRTMAPMAFVVCLDPYNLPEERRFLIAERHGIVVGILVAVPIYSINGWFFEDVLRDPEAPNGTVELLFDYGMNLLAKEGCTRVTYGLAPLAHTPYKWLRVIRDNTGWLYDFEGIRAFKAKLLPQEWRPVYVGYDKKEMGILAVRDVLAAFANGSFIRFAWKTLIHRASTVVAILALLLIPWTLLLAAASPPNWFPSQMVQFAWITFDIFLLHQLLGLAAKWNKTKAIMLSGAACVDFSLGVTQATLYNFTKTHTPVEWLLLITALAAPLFATIYLWSAHNRLCLYQNAHIKRP